MTRTIFAELVDLTQLHGLCESFTRLTGAVTAILDLDGNILIATGWQDICVEFHRKHPETACRCRESDTHLAQQLASGHNYNVYKCKNGLVDVAIPIVIGDQHVANFFTGQFFFEPPSRERFEQQALRFGYDRDKYMEALDRVPILSEFYVRTLMDFFNRLTRLIGEMGQARKETEQALGELSKSTNMLNTVLDTVPQSIFWKDRDGVYLGCNRVFANHAGFENPEEIIGKTDYDLPWPSHEAEAYRRDDIEVLETGQQKLHIVEPLQKKDGTRIWIDTSKAPLLDEDRCPLGVLGIYNDITDQKVAEEKLRQMEKMNAIGQLAGGIAHDFNNQLAGIMGYADLLHDSLTDPELLRYTQHIVAASHRASDLTSKLLAFARKGQYQSVVLDINEMIREVCDFLSHSIHKKVAIRLHLLASPSTTRGDPTLLENALLNIAINAADATDEQGTLTFTTNVTNLDESRCHQLSAELRPGTYLSIAIADTGAGIPKENLPHIFEPFFSTKKQNKGTGLGLAAVYGTIKQHHGAIDVESTPGSGTTFTLYLPIEHQKATQPSLPEQMTAVSRPATILIVDDEEAIRNLVVDMLSMHGYSVVTAPDGQVALDYYRANWRTIDAVVLDMVMPVMDGPETYRAMKEINPSVRVLLASGYSLNNETRNLLADGVNGFIQKPYRRLQILDRLAAVLAENSTSSKSHDSAKTSLSEQDNDQ